ncbi:MAG: coproporphyrinogen III oxidase family protein [Candidatus Odinarchaeota archaeon]
MINSLIRFAVQFEGRKFLKMKKVDQAFDRTNKNSKFKNKASLYVHIPFCRRLCPYCSFNRYSYNEDKTRLYFANLKKEVGYYIDRGFSFDQVYFGGGTPTVDINQLLDFLDYLHESFTIKQISLETNPTDVNKNDLKELLNRKVKRFSIGIQSFNNDILKNTGRSYIPGEELVERIKIAKGIFDTLNIDLIFNMPGQTIEQFKQDVDIFKDLEIDQVTFYPLMPSSRRKSALERRFNKINTAQEQKLYQVILDEIFHDKHFTASTPWCFTRVSRDKKMIDEYIVDYDDYVGTGAGAVSQVGGIFYTNSFSLERYDKLINKGRLPVVSYFPLPLRDSFRYFLLTKLFGLKLNGKAFEERFNRNLEKTLWLELLILKNMGIVRKRNGMMRVTENGLYHVSTLMKEFFTALNNLRELYITHEL